MQFAEPAEFVRIRPDHVMAVVVPPHVDPSDAHPPPDCVPVDREPTGQTRGSILVRTQPDGVAVRWAVPQAELSDQTQDHVPREPVRPLRRAEPLGVQLVRDCGRVESPGAQRRASIRRGELLWTLDS